MIRTFYVTQDEEILSIVGKLRSSDLLENVFVIPKRALVLQSVVNLRMLSREAGRSGKKVIVVTQDDNGRKLAEKAGLETRPYTEESFREPEPIVVESTGPVPVKPHLTSSSALGSSGFFASTTETGNERRSPAMKTDPMPSALPKTAGPEGNDDGTRPLRVRNLSPVRQTALNSLRDTEISDDAPTPFSSSSRFSEPPVSPSMPGARIPERPVAIESGDGRLSKIFSSSRSESWPPIGRPVQMPRPDALKPKREKPERSTVRVGGREQAWFSFFVIISVLFILGTGSIILLPKAEISVTPRSVSQNLELEFSGETNPESDGARVVPVRIVEREEEVVVNVDSSGSSAGNGSKSSGSVIIYNEYGSQPQSLVATTRFVTDDGKIFRLVRGVTVPGMSGGEPGIVEAEVVADTFGEAYDIGPSDFSVPGFSGSAKAGKVYARSKSSMTGGSSVGDSGTPAVSSGDLAAAATQAVDRFRESFAASITESGSENEQFIPEMFDISTVGSASAPQEGSVASSFEYRVTLRGRAFVFSEDDLLEKIVPILRDRAAVDGSYATHDLSFRYSAGGADYDAGTFRFQVGSSVLFVAPVDTGTLREDFLGKRKTGEELQKVLDLHREVAHMNVSISPDWFAFAIPKDRKRVTVTVLAP